MEITPNHSSRVYWQHPDVSSWQSQIVRQGSDAIGNFVVLDATIFHPQGGGQPSDIGTIDSGRVLLSVHMVKAVEDEIRHYYTSTADEPTAGPIAEVKIDFDRRKLHSRLHSAGHLLDQAVRNFLVEARPLKGYHFPDGPYVEYTGQLPENVAVFMAQCNAWLAERLKQGGVVATVVRDDRSRTVAIAEDGPVPCGGTHVSSLVEIGQVSVHKIKKTREGFRASYRIS